MERTYFLEQTCSIVSSFISFLSRLVYLATYRTFLWRRFWSSTHFFRTSPDDLLYSGMASKSIRYNMNKCWFGLDLQHFDKQLQMYHRNVYNVMRNLWYKIRKNVVVLKLTVHKKNKWTRYVVCSIWNSPLHIEVTFSLYQVSEETKCQIKSLLYLFFNNRQRGYFSIHQLYNVITTFTTWDDFELALNRGQELPYLSSYCQSH